MIFNENTTASQLISFIFIRSLAIRRAEWKKWRQTERVSPVMHAIMASCATSPPPDSQINRFDFDMHEKTACIPNDASLFSISIFPSFGLALRPSAKTRLCDFCLVFGLKRNLFASHGARMKTFFLEKENPFSHPLTTTYRARRRTAYCYKAVHSWNFFVASLPFAARFGGMHCWVVEND